MENIYSSLEQWMNHFNVSMNQSILDNNVDHKTKKYGSSNKKDVS